MIQVKEELLKEFHEWVHFLERIKDLDWNKPQSEGKWSIHDIVSHIYKWDEYFLGKAIAPIANGKALTVQHLNFDEFNAQAAEYGRTKSKQELIDLSIQCRKEILEHIQNQDISAFNKEFTDGDGKPFNIEAYLKDFIGHDRHHMKQIEEREDVLQVS